MFKVYERRRQVVVALVLVSMIGAVAVIRGGAATPAGLSQGGVPELLINLQNSVNAISAREQANVRYTPSAFVVGQARCEVVNVSQETQTVQLRVIRGDGTVAANTGAFPLAAGTASRSQARSISGQVYCQILVVDGSRTDVRGNLAVTTDENAADFLVVPAE